MSSKYAKLTAAKLQAECKRIGTKSTGSKDELLGRLEAFETCEELGLKAYNGINPALITTPSHMNIANAKCGLSTMLDSWDQLLQQLVKHLKANSPSSSSSSASSSSSSSSSSNSSDSGVEVAQRVLQLDEVDDWLGILNIATPKDGPQLLSTSSTAAMRKAYLKLSLLIHPDKLGRVFQEATKAFQALVRAFERLSSPSYAAEAPSSSGRGSGAKKDVATISRSNEGCFRTRGYRQYTCSTCLFGFGCMTAIHKCPHCQSSFEYSPADYHRKITCTREKCGKPFGFFMFKASDRVLEDLKRDVKLEVETWAKQKEAKERRAARSGDRNSLSRKEEIRAYLLGLSDSCPLCGIELEDLTEEVQRDHLRECKGNAAAHAAYSQKKAVSKAKAESKDKKIDMQHSVQSEAAFMLLGAQPEQLWLMDDQALGRVAKLRDMDSEGASRDELIARLASSSSGAGRALAITSQGGEGAGQKIQLTADSVPRNYHSLSLAQLKSVLAAHGRVVDGEMDRGDVLAMIETEIFGDNKPKAKMMIEEGQGAASKRRRKLSEDEDEDFSP